jgi:hypothetical protein
MLKLRTEQDSFPKEWGQAGWWRNEVKEIECLTLKEKNKNSS